MSPSQRSQTMSPSRRPQSPPTSNTPPQQQHQPQRSTTVNFGNTNARLQGLLSGRGLTRSNTMAADKALPSPAPNEGQVGLQEPAGGGFRQYEPMKSPASPAPPANGNAHHTETSRSKESTPPPPVPEKPSSPVSPARADTNGRARPDAPPDAATAPEVSAPSAPISEKAVPTSTPVLPPGKGADSTGAAESDVPASDAGGLGVTETKTLSSSVAVETSASLEHPPDEPRIAPAGLSPTNQGVPAVSELEAEPSPVRETSSLNPPASAPSGTVPLEASSTEDASSGQSETKAPLNGTPETTSSLVTPDTTVESL